MNGLKAFVLQDLPIVSSKGLHRSTKLPSCNLHCATSSRRFWNLFEFSNKTEVPHDSKRCEPSKDIVPTERIACETEDVWTNPPSVPTIGAITSMTMNSRLYGYKLDPRVTPINMSEMNPLKNDDFMSLLDGNPVPKTMKWKLKGYKTLRRRRTDDFAFVPGAKYDYDVDILSSSNCNAMGDVQTSPKTAKNANALGKDIILSAKAIETKDRAEFAPRNEIIRSEQVEVTKINEAKRKFQTEELNSSNPMETGVVSSAKIQVAQKLLSLPKVEKIIYLPISKPEAPVMKCQSQPSAPYSSRPPDDSRKPPLHPQWLEKIGATGKSSLNSRKKDHPIEYREQSQPPDIARQTSSIERSSWRTEEGPEVREETYTQPETVKPVEETLYAEAQPETKTTEPRESDYQPMNKSISSDQSNSPQIPKLAERKMSKEESKNLAHSWKHESVDDQVRFQKKIDKTSLRSVYESMGIPSRETPPLKIVSPSLDQAKTSPCAATRARLQQNGGSQRQQVGSFGFDGSSMAGNGGGSRKPPGSYPPFPSRRSSSNSSLLVKPARVLRKSKAVNAKTSSKNISTGGERSTPKRRDEDDGDMIEGKSVCTKPRENKCSRDQHRPKQKPCKRYCCPALQVSSDCDWDKFQCPKQKGQQDCNRAHERKRQKPKRDPTCLPEETEADASREVCTSPRKSTGRRDKCDREREDRSCDRQASQRRERQSCKREQRSCERKDRSCERQERRQRCDREQGGREICTKPRSRESCDRRRDSCDRDRRSTKCNGRRNYTQLAYTRQPSGRKNINRFFSMSSLGLPFVGAANNKCKHSLFCNPSMSRFYGKKGSPCDKPPSCESAKKKCEKPPAKCLNQRTENKCRAREETLCGKPERKASPCGSSDKATDMCARKREDICKSRKAATSSEEAETAKERAERERKEIERCKKDITGKDKNKKKGGKSVTGLERVVSPCKQKGGLGSSGSCGQAACSAVNCLPGVDSSLFVNRDNNFTITNSLPDRPYSTASLGLIDHDEKALSDVHRNDYWNLDDNVLADAGHLQGFLRQSEDATTDSSYGNWFLSWLHG
ncbi:uncharacterized protein LOC116427356 [Nomia melanderi]|uniref:uncharacterized protein LOC116427356 n=1 Tax=Nomia melanderi TaxID=2448451 RepID=UPI003FCCEFA1